MISGPLEGRTDAACRLWGTFTEGAMKLEKEQETMNASECERKSILDGMEIKESGFPVGGTGTENRMTIRPKLEIVGHCPQCNSPVYGPKRINENEEPVVKYGCDCRQFTRKAIHEVMHTK